MALSPNISEFKVSTMVLFPSFSGHSVTPSETFGNSHRVPSYVIDALCSLISGFPSTYTMFILLPPLPLPLPSPSWLP